MIHTLIELANVLTIVTLVALLFLKTKGRGILFLGALSMVALLGISTALLVFARSAVVFSYPGSFISGPIVVRLDALSAWFILTISFIFLAGGWYGFEYLKKYRERSTDLALHYGAFLTALTALIDVCAVQNAFVFLVVWEIMALCSFVIVIFDHQQKEALKAGINFLIQSHISVLFLTLSFMWVRIKTGSFDFSAITAFSTSEPALAGLGLFLFIFVGFAIKAGFVPFHTWLPLAHPAAPAHVSGVMSGVIIKIGIYGILRMLLLIKTDMVTVGYLLVTVSVISGVYGVMLAIIQHNLKKLLAYHSIENIGIIGMGIGLGCLGLGYENAMLTICGFGGALLHTTNHSLFKSLLFFGAGNVYQFRHTMDIERMGGLIKRMPHTAWLFLVGALAICGLPPFNGFVSEFFIYVGLFNGLQSNGFQATLFMLFAIVALVLIGGLALICFTKAFGIIFLGASRDHMDEEQVPETPLRVVPLYVIAAIIMGIGIMPFLLAKPLVQSVQLYQSLSLEETRLLTAPLIDTLTSIGWYSMGFIALALLLLGVRYVVTRNRTVRDSVTWGCGYSGDTSKMQYTASSYIRTFRKLAEPALSVEREKKEPDGLYPGEVGQVTHPGDKMEWWLIDKPLGWYHALLNRFAFLQNGKIQAYILYGVVFVSLILLIPLLFGQLGTLLDFLNRL